MQSLFAYQTCRVAEYNIYKKKAQDQFLPDLNSMEVQDKEALAKDREDVAETFDLIYEKGIDAVPVDTKKEIIKEAEFFLEQYEDRIIDIQKPVQKKMVSDLLSIHDDYIKLVVLILSIADEIEAVKNKKGISHNNFAKNVIIQALKGSEELETERVKKNLSWDSDTIKTWHREILRNEEFFEQYDDKVNPKFEDDQEFILTFYKNFIFKNEDIENYFESLDLNWTENKSILKSMVLKTIKSVDAVDSDPLLMELSKNWEEDLSFLKELFQLSLENEEKYSEWIKSKSKNWEIERVATTDRIILQMALAEMIHFPSIPVKVTINEYIELSKQYSTPKSKQFVNGLLDVLSVDLQKDGVIRKSGRGLLDNK